MFLLRSCRAETSSFVFPLLICNLLFSAVVETYLKLPSVLSDLPLPKTPKLFLSMQNVLEKNRDICLLKWDIPYFCHF